MPSMAQVPVQAPGGFHLQYTDAAQAQAARLDTELRNRMHNHLNMVASVNPHLHGKPVPGYMTSDRKTLEFEKLMVTFWISTPVKVMTVVDIREGDDREEAMRRTPTPAAGTLIPFSGGFVGFDDDEDPEEAMVGASQSAG